MAGDETMVSDVILANGLRKVDIIRFGQLVDVDEWAKKLVPGDSWDTWSYWDFVEDPTGLKLSHLYLFWKSRGPVSYRKLKQELVNDPLHCQEVIPDYGILWWIEKGESVSFSADVAATLYKQTYGLMPSAAWVKKLPIGAKDVIEVGEGDDHVMLVLQVGDWVPDRYVVVGCQDQNLLTTKDTENTKGSAK